MKVSVFDRSGNERVLDKRIADILERKGKVTYQTRMMQAEQPMRRVEQEQPEEELDSAGDAWDEHMHVSTKLKNVDGTWRKRPGARLADE